MARFSSFIHTDRGSEVSRMGHSSIRSVTMTGEISVHVDCLRLGERAPYTERVKVWLDRGYGDYSTKDLYLCQIDEYGRVSVCDDFLDKVREHNERIDKRLKK